MRIRREGRGHAVERWFRRTIPACEAEIPIFDLTAAAMPLIRPREDEHACATRIERGMDLRLQEMRLRLLTVAPAVQAQFTHDERTLACYIQQPGKIVGQAALG